VLDPSSQETYWYNRQTRETTWDDPMPRVREQQRLLAEWEAEEAAEASAAAASTAPAPAAASASATAPVAAATAAPSIQRAPSSASGCLWRAAKDANGDTYYYHRVTKATSWDRPEEYESPRQEASATAASPATAAAAATTAATVAPTTAVDAAETTAASSPQANGTAPIATADSDAAEPSSAPASFDARANAKKSFSALSRELIPATAFRDDSSDEDDDAEPDSAALEEAQRTARRAIAEDDEEEEDEDGDATAAEEDDDKEANDDKEEDEDENDAVAELASPVKSPSLVSATGTSAAGAADTGVAALTLPAAATIDAPSSESPTSAAASSRSNSMDLGAEPQLPTHGRTVSEATGIGRATSATVSGPASPGGAAAAAKPAMGRTVSASLSLSSSARSPPTPSSAGSAAAAAKSKCTVSECMCFGVRDGYCLRHQWRLARDAAERLEAPQSPRRAKQAQGQLQAAKEILTTEKSYLEQLRTLHRSFLARLQVLIPLSRECGRPPPCSEEDLDVIFLNLPMLLSIAESLHADLAELHANDRLVEMGALVLLHYAPQLQVYAMFLEGFDDSRKRVQELKESSAEFRDFVRIQEKVEGLSLESFLVTPVQRLPRYLLLLKELSRRIPPCPEDPLTTQVLKDLAQAHDDLADMTKTLNSRLSTAEGYNQLRNLSRLFVQGDPRFVAFVSPHRRLLRMGVLRKKFSSSSYNLSDHKRYFFFLCTDLIFYAAPAAKSFVHDEESIAAGQSHVALAQAVKGAAVEGATPLFKMKHCYLLEDLYCDRNDPKAARDKRGQIVPKPLAHLTFYMWNQDGRVIELAAGTEQERDDWFTALEQAIEAAHKKAALKAKAKKKT